MGHFYRAYSHDVMAAILVFQNNKTAAMLVYQDNPVGIELSFLCKNFLLFVQISIDACHMTAYTLYLCEYFLKFIYHSDSPLNVIWSYCLKDTTKRAVRMLYFSGRLDHAILFLVDANVLPLNSVYYQTTVNFRL